MEQTERGSRLRALDCLRGLAALAVVVYHYWFRIGEIYPSVAEPLVAVKFGQYGVHLFFLISGFVIFMTLQRATPKSFIVSRFIRLYPIFWICALITFLVVAVFGLPGRGVTPLEGLINATMLQAYFGVPHIDGAYWTLMAEIGFYVQVGVLYFCGLLKERRLVWTLYAWIVLTVAIGQGIKSLPHGPISDIANNLNQGLVWVPLFVIGIAFYKIWSGDRGLALKALPLVVTVLMLLKDRNLGIAIACIMILFTIALWGPRMRGIGAPLAWLGFISYPLYLLHQNIGYVIQLWLNSLGAPHWLGASVALLAIVGLAALLAFYVDAPVRRFLRRKLLSSSSASRNTVAAPTT